MKAIDVVMVGGDGWLLVLSIAKLRNLRVLAQAMRELAPALWLTSFVVEFPIKKVLARPRPFKTLVLSAIVGRRHQTYSLPSGHSATAFAGAWLLQRYFPRWSPVLYAGAALVAFSRVYLGVHYVTDVIIGGAVGTVLARVFHTFIKGFRRRSQ